MVLRRSPRTLLSMLKPTFGDSTNFKVNQPTKISLIFSANEKVLVRLNKNHWEEAVIVKPLSYNRYLVNHDNRFKEVHVHQMKRFYAKGSYSPLNGSTDSSPGSPVGASVATPNVVTPAVDITNTSVESAANATESPSISEELVDQSPPGSPSDSSTGSSPDTSMETSEPGTRPTRQRREPDRFRFSFFNKK